MLQVNPWTAFRRQGNQNQRIPSQDTERARGRGDTGGGSRPAPHSDERHTEDSPARREDQRQVREVLRPASRMPGTRGAPWTAHPGARIGGPWSGPPRLHFVRLSPTAKAPARSTEGAIGYDLYAPFSFTLYPREIKLVYTDIALKVPVGHYGRVAPKSGLTLRHHVTVLARVVDPDYTGNVGVVLYNLSPDTKFTRLVGESIAQLILEVASIFPTLEINALPPTARGPYGFGSHD